MTIGKAAPLALTPATEKLQYRAVDTAGNVQKWQKIKWNEVKTPQTDIERTETAGNDGWYTGDVTLTITPDNGADIMVIQYSLNGSDWVAYDTPITATEGYNTISWKSISAGGIEDPVQTAVIKVDSNPPECTRSITVSAGEGILELCAGDSGTWQGGSPTLYAFVFTSGATPSEDTLLGSSMIAEDGSFAALGDEDTGDDIIFSVGNYDLYVVNVLTMSWSSAVTVRVP